MGEINRGGLPDLDFSRLFFWSLVVPEKSRLFAQFSRLFGDLKSRLISTSRLIPTNDDFPRLSPKYPDLPRLDRTIKLEETLFLEITALDLLISQ